MAKTDKPKKDGSGAKKSKAKDVRQPLGEKGTFASKTPNVQVNTRGKKKGSKAKPKQPQAAPPVDQFEVCENIQSDCFLPISDIDSFSDCCCDEGNQAAMPPMDEDAFDTVVKSLCISPLKNLPEQSVEIDNTLHVLSNDKEEPLCESVSSPSLHRPLPQPLQTFSAPLLPSSVISLPTQLMPASPLPPAPLSSPLPSPQQMSHSAGCSARTHRLPTIDMFNLREPTAPVSASSLTSLPISPALLSLPPAPPRSLSTQRPVVVNTISPSPPQMFNSTAPAPTGHLPHQSRNLAQGSVAPAWQSNQLTALPNRPLPQPLMPSTRLLLQPQNANERLKNGSRVIVSKGMHEGRRGIVRGVQRAGKKGPLQYGLWSVLLDGKDIVALSDEFLTLC